MEHTKCKFCLEEINADAKKCPHCQSMQGGDKAFMYQNLMPALIIVPVMGFIMVAMLFYAKKEDKNNELSMDQLEIIETKVHKIPSKDEPSIVLIGKIVNNTEKSFQEIFFHVDYFDSVGKMIDTYSDYTYDLYINPQCTTSFRLVSFPARNLDLYRDHKVTIKHVERIRSF